MHRIRRQIIELDLPREEGAHALQQRVNGLFRDHIHPNLERLFDELEVPGQTIRIEQLVLDMGELPPAALEREFAAHFLQRLEQQIRAQMASHDLENTQTVTRSASERQWEIITFFLQHGHLPWFAAGAVRLADLQEFLLLAFQATPDNVVEHLWPLLIRFGPAVERLVYQFGPRPAIPILEQGNGRYPLGFGSSNGRKKSMLLLRGYYRHGRSLPSGDNWQVLPRTFRKALALTPG